MLRATHGQCDEQKHSHMTGHARILLGMARPGHRGGPASSPPLPLPSLSQTAGKGEEVVHLIPMQHFGSQRKLLVWKQPFRDKKRGKPGTAHR